MDKDYLVERINKLLSVKGIDALCDCTDAKRIKVMCKDTIHDIPKCWKILGILVHYGYVKEYYWGETESETISADNPVDDVSSVLFDTFDILYKLNGEIIAETGDDGSNISFGDFCVEYNKINLLDRFDREIAQMEEVLKLLSEDDLVSIVNKLHEDLSLSDTDPDAVMTTDNMNKISDIITDLTRLQLYEKDIDIDYNAVVDYVVGA